MKKRSGGRRKRYIQLQNSHRAHCLAHGWAVEGSRGRVGRLRGHGGLERQRKTQDERI